MPSKDFDTWLIVERADGITFGVAALVALVSGMGMYYVKSPTFGSLQDYLALFTWGAGVLEWGSAA